MIAIGQEGMHFEADIEDLVFWVATFLWLLAMAVYRLLRVLIEISINVRASEVDGNRQGVSERVSALKSLVVTVRVIIWGIGPFSIIVFARILNVQQFFDSYMPPESLVFASLAALFSFWVIMRMWIENVEVDLTVLFRPRREAD